MLSPGDNPSSRPCSIGWGTLGGLEGGCGGGRLGLCRGLGAGRDLLSVPVRDGGEDRREWGVPSGPCPGEEAGSCPRAQPRPYGDGVLGGVGDRLTGDG